MYYLDAYHKNFFADKMLPYLRINGTEEYWRALDQNLSETMIGRMQPKEALDRTYKEWNEITERRGKAKQLKQYQEAVGYKNWFLNPYGMEYYFIPFFIFLPL